MRSRKIRLAVDIGMALLLPLLMAYSLIGELFHEIAGTVMTVLIVIHLVQNRKWLGAIFQGRYHAKRVFQTILDLMLLVFMILEPVSGILLSKHLYTFIRVPGVASWMRQIHMALAYWGFLLMSMHAGTHLTALFGKLLKQKAAVKTGVLCAIAAVCLYGIYAFIRRGFGDYLFLKTMFAFFDYSESRIVFILDYLAVMILFAVIGLVITEALLKSGKQAGEKAGKSYC